MFNDWSANKAARDAAFAAGKQAYAAGNDVVPSQFDTPDLRARFFHGYDIAAWRAAKPKPGSER